MDESHRYRGKAGMRAINELKPILGLELTATPQIENGRRVGDFKNVIYSYPLSSALNDGFVKEPAVATRENFRADELRRSRPGEAEAGRRHSYPRAHQGAARHLRPREHGSHWSSRSCWLWPRTPTHANDLLKRDRRRMTSSEGRYKGKVITVHSNQTRRGEGRNGTTASLRSKTRRTRPRS